MNAQAKIDWLSFTIPLPTPQYSGTDAAWEHVHELIRLNIGDVWSPIFDCGDWQVQQGRGVYQAARVDAKTEVRLSIGDVNADVYVECSGVACERVRSAGCFYDIFQCKEVRFSRIDLACDFDTNIDVEDIIRKGYKKSIKSRADYRTVQGDTTYIGSRKSERMLRVYRYHKPHPRSHLLRFEVEIKGDSAKQLAPQITESSCAEVCFSALKAFELRHELVANALATASPLKARQYDKAKKGRMRWLMTQVLPAIVKAHKEGDIDVSEWFETFVLPACE